jgi:hypothetical protein
MKLESVAFDLTLDCQSVGPVQKKKEMKDISIYKKKMIPG